MGIFSFFKRNKSEENKSKKDLAESHIEINRDNCKACQRWLLRKANPLLKRITSAGTVRSVLQLARMNV